MSIVFTPNEMFPKYTAHTPEGIKQFDNEIDAHLSTHHTTNTKLITPCGVLIGLGMNYQTMVELNEYAGCPEPHNCADTSVWLEGQFREELNKAIEETN